jgi:hypothetical protein
MKLLDLEKLALSQLGLDTDDLNEQKTNLDIYLNEGYDKLLKVYKNVHTGETGYPILSTDTQEPLTPAWSHRAIADYATWALSRNGSAQKQNKGAIFWNTFNDMEAQLVHEAVYTPLPHKLKNIY